MCEIIQPVAAQVAVSVSVYHYYIAVTNYANKAI